MRKGKVMPQAEKICTSVSNYGSIISDPMARLAGAHGSFSSLICLPLDYSSVFNYGH